MTEHLLAAIAWSVGGFMLGFATCWIVLQARRADRRNAKAVTMTTLQTPSLDKVRTTTGILILILLVLTSISYYRRTECQTQYNREVAQSLVARSEAQRVQAVAQIELLTASISGDPALALQETREYIEAVRELERVRAEAPLPAAPDCGGWS